MEDALLFQLREAVDKYMHHAQLLEDTMAGAGTKDSLLISRVVRFRMHSALLSDKSIANDWRVTRLGRESHAQCPGGIRETVPEETLKQDRG